MPENAYSVGFVTGMVTLCVCFLLMGFSIGAMFVEWSVTNEARRYGVSAELIHGRVYYVMTSIEYQRHVARCDNPNCNRVRHIDTDEDMEEA